MACSFDGANGTQKLVQPWEFQGEITISGDRRKVAISMGGCIPGCVPKASNMPFRRPFFPSRLDLRRVRFHRIG
jgi:hypothetical protein